MERIKVRHEKFQQLARSTDSSTNTEFRELRKSTVLKYCQQIKLVCVNVLIIFLLISDLTKELKAAEKDLKGVRGAVDMVLNFIMTLIHQICKLYP